MLFSSKLFWNCLGFTKVAKNNHSQSRFHQSNDTLLTSLMKTLLLCFGLTPVKSQFVSYQPQTRKCREEESSCANKFEEYLILLLSNEMERYKVLKKIGKGNEGTVYKAVDTETGTFVAVKETHVRNNDDLTRIQEVISLVKQLSEDEAHGVHVCKIIAHSIEQVEQPPQQLQQIELDELHKELPIMVAPSTPQTEEYKVFTVMEYCDASLDQLISECFEYISLETKLNWIRQAAEVLDFLHAKFIVHRDLKPQNFLLKALPPSDSPTKSPQIQVQSPFSPHSVGSPSNNSALLSPSKNNDIVDPSCEYLIKLVDFGFTKQTAGMMNSFVGTLINNLNFYACKNCFKIGTPSYMSPECYNTRKYDVSTDIWSFGMVILRMAVFPVRFLHTF